jgi:LysM repeat protein
MRPFTALSNHVFDRIVNKDQHRKRTLRIAAAGVGIALTAGIVHYVTVQPGDTLSGIAASACGNASDWSGIYNQNQSVVGSNPNLIYAGEHLQFQCNAGTVLTAVSDPPSRATSATSAPTTSYTASPGSFQACVISRESGGDPEIVNGSSGAGGLYQFMPATWAELGYAAEYPGGAQTAPVSVQNAAFEQLYAEDGASPWAPSDGC